MLRALFPQAVFMPTQRSLHATVKLHSQYYHTDVQASVAAALEPELAESRAGS
jgi:hypothetical protein